MNSKAELANKKIDDLSVASDGDVRSRVAFLRDRIACDYFEIGRLLRYISKKALYAEWCDAQGRRYSSFSMYVECEVDFALRKAKLLMSLWRWFGEDLGGDEETLAKVSRLGWSKSALLVGVAGKDTLDEWLGVAETLTQRQLTDATRRALSKGGRRRGQRPGFEPVGVKPDVQGLPVPGKIGLRSMWAVALDDEQRRSLDQAMEIASVLGGTEKPGQSQAHLLSLILEDFVARHSDSAGSSLPQGSSLSRAVLEMDLRGFSATPYGLRPEGQILSYVQPGDTAMADPSPRYFRASSQRAEVVRVTASKVFVRFDNGVVGEYSSNELSEVRRRDESELAS